jgi:predicted  nucleic acid-binding Zn-ribbon protein
MAVGTAMENQAAVEATENSITELRKSIAELEDALKPKQDELGQAESRIAELRKREEKVAVGLADVRGAWRTM